MPIEIESPEEFDYDLISYNLSESSMPDLKMSALNLSLNDLELSYIAHRGKPEFRDLLADTFGMPHQNNVLITNGAAGALFIVNTALLSSTHHLIVLRPNYATNIEVPRAIGCEISFIDLNFDEEWKINPEKIKAAIKPNTKLISITTPHNPTGMVMSEDEIDKIIIIAEQHKIHLLVDETYRDTCFKTPYPLAAIKSDLVISVSSVSKAYGLPGLRIGWLITKSKMMEQFLAAKEMIYINNSALDEEVAYQFYLKKDEFAKTVNTNALANLELFKNWLKSETRMETILPEGGVVCFARIKENVCIDTARFYEILTHKYKTMVGAGHWFEMPDNYMRVGFGFTTAANFEKGLESITKAIDECMI
jgi:aspartate/methionine/tyrosine aminotransferase